MRTALVKATVSALPAVYKANLEFQSHVPFQHPHTRAMDSRTRGRRGFCTLVHSFYKKCINFRYMTCHVCGVSIMVFEV